MDQTDSVLGQTNKNYQDGGFFVLVDQFRVCLLGLYRVNQAEPSKKGRASEATPDVQMDFSSDSYSANANEDKRVGSAAFGLFIDEKSIREY